MKPDVASCSKQNVSEIHSNGLRGVFKENQWTKEVWKLLLPRFSCSATRSISTTNCRQESHRSFAPFHRFHYHLIDGSSGRRDVTSPCVQFLLLPHQRFVSWVARFLLMVRIIYTSVSCPYFRVFMNAHCDSGDKKQRGWTEWDMWHAWGRKEMHIRFWWETFHNKFLTKIK